MDEHLVAMKARQLVVMKVPPMEQQKVVYSADSKACLKAVPWVPLTVVSKDILKAGHWDAQTECVTAERMALQWDNQSVEMMVVQTAAQTELWMAEMKDVYLAEMTVAHSVLQWVELMVDKMVECLV
jgi:hypothetical protein